MRIGVTPDQPHRPALAPLWHHYAAAQDLAAVAVEQAGSQGGCRWQASPAKVSHQLTAGGVPDSIAFEKRSPEAAATKVVQGALVGEQAIGIQFDRCRQHLQLVGAQAGAARAYGLHWQRVWSVRRSFRRNSIEASDGIPEAEMLQLLDEADHVALLTASVANPPP
jgi:hypothetical protein